MVNNPYGIEFLPHGAVNSGRIDKHKLCRKLYCECGITMKIWGYRLSRIQFIFDIINHALKYRNKMPCKVRFEKYERYCVK